jgi:hypothetical protein
LKALEYIKNNGGMQKIREHEQKLVKVCLEGFKKYQEKIEIL